VRRSQKEGFEYGEDAGASPRPGSESKTEGDEGANGVTKVGMGLSNNRIQKKQIQLREGVLKRESRGAPTGRCRSAGVVAISSRSGGFFVAFHEKSVKGSSKAPAGNRKWPGRQRRTACEFSLDKEWASRGARAI